MEETAIKITGVSKKYSVGASKDDSLRGHLTSILSSAKSKTDSFWALKDVSFEVKKGEVIGIIGKNGAGKSTLLKILSQITKPTEGKIEINGRVASLLEVGTGFHPELTGRENIYLNGTILGMTRKEVRAKFDEIVEFSGVKKFIDTPVKHYSSGMYVRLAFSVAAHLEPEILIIDEVLAVGDDEFQKKCLGKMKDVADHGRTVLFVSHNMVAVESLCSKSVLIQNGKAHKVEDTGKVITQYLNGFRNAGNENALKSSNVERQGTGEVQFMSASLKNNGGEIIKEINVGEGLTIDVEIKNNMDRLIKNIDIGFSIHKSRLLDKNSIIYSSYNNKLFSLNENENKVVSCKIPYINYSEDTYCIKGIIQIDNEISDWVSNPMLEFKLNFSNFFESGKGHGANEAPVVLKAEWE